MFVYSYSNRYTHESIDNQLQYSGIPLLWTAYSVLVNSWRMREGYGSRSVCVHVCVCVSVCACLLLLHTSFKSLK